MHAAARLRERLQGHRMIEGPCVYDAMTALQTEQAGLDFMVLGAGGTANFLYGLPDMGLLSFSEIIDNVRRVSNATTLPVIADLDDAGGDPAHVHRNVQLAEAAGAAALMIEDVERSTKHRWSEEQQGWDLATDRLRPIDEAVETIRIAAAARNDPDTVILGRTDAFLIEGLDAAVTRAQALAEAGAELIMMTQFPGDSLSAEIVGSIPAALVHAESDGPTLETRARFAGCGVFGLVYALEPLLGAFFGFRAALEQIRGGVPAADAVPAWEGNKELLATVGLRQWTGPSTQFGPRGDTDDGVGGERG